MYKRTNTTIPCDPILPLVGNLPLVQKFGIDHRTDLAWYMYKKHGPIFKLGRLCVESSVTGLW